MAGFDGNITIGTTVDMYGINRGLNQITKGFKKLNKLAAAGLGIGALIKLGASALEAASNLQEVQNIVDVSFGELSDKMERFAATAIESYGMSEYSAKKTGSAFMAMGKSMGLAMDEAANMSIRLTALTGDMASFYNISQEYAQIALSAVYTGETETLKKYGIVLTEANLQQYALSKGIETNVKKMDARSKAILRYNYILQATRDMEGDFVRTQDTWANQMKVLKQRWQEFLIVVGNGLIQILTPLLKTLNAIIAELTRFAQIIGSVLTKVFGIKWDNQEEKTKGMADNIKAAADSEDDLADAIDKANKKLKKQLQSYDELNNLTKHDKDTSGEDLLNGLGVGGVDDLLEDLNKEPSNTVPKWVESLIDILNRLKAKLKEIADFFNLGFLDAWNWLNIDEQIRNLQEQFGRLVQNIKDIIDGTKDHWNNFINTIAFALGEIVASVYSIIISIVTMVVQGVNQFIEENKQRIIEYINFVLDTLSAMAVQTAMFVRAIAAIIQGIVDPVSNMIAQVVGIIATIFMGVTSLFLKLARDIEILFTQPVIDNVQGISKTIGELVNFIAERLRAVKLVLQEVFDYANQKYDEKIKPLFSSVTKGLSEIVKAWTEAWDSNIKPKLDEMGRRFDEFLQGPFDTAIKQIIDLIGQLADSVKVFWEDCLQPVWKWCIENLTGPAMQAIQDKFNWFITWVELGMTAFGDFIKFIEKNVKYITDFLSGNWDELLKDEEGIVNSSNDLWHNLFVNILKHLGIDDEHARFIVDNFSTFINQFINDLGVLIESFFSDFNMSADGLNQDVETMMLFFDDLGNTIQTVLDAIGMAFNRLVDLIRNGASEILGFFDKIGSGLSSIGSGMSIFGGGISIPNIKIPHLAQGAVIPPNREFMAMLGDQHSGTNVEAPLATIQEALYNALLQAGLTGGNSNNQDIVVQIDGREIARAVRREDNIFRKSTGTSMFAY